MGGKENAYNTCNPVAAATFMTGVFMGTIMTIVIKVLYETYSYNSLGQYVPYEKPLTTTIAMFVGMMMALPIHLIKELVFTAPKDRNVDFPLWVYLLFIVPSIFDLIGTAFAKVRAKSQTSAFSKSDPLPVFIRSACSTSRCRFSSCCVPPCSFLPSSRSTSSSAT